MRTITNRSILHMLVTLFLIVLFSAIPAPAYTTEEANQLVAGPTVWPPQIPANCPFPKSNAFGGIIFSGRHIAYTSADTWYPSWASDGNLYSGWTDGTVNGNKVSSGGGAKAHTGHARIIGDDPMNLTIEHLGKEPASALPYGGRYPSAYLVHNGVWYYGTYCLTVRDKDLNWDVLGPFVGFRTSTDYGKTWTPCPHTPEKPLFGEPAAFKGPVRIGSPHFVDFGKNMEHSPDGKAYLIAHGALIPDPESRKVANASWITGDAVYLIRVTPTIDNINDASKYEFFAGLAWDKKLLWTSDMQKMVPLAEWNNNMGCVTMTYNAPLKKYIMCVTDGGTTKDRYNTYMLESDSITGPFKIITYMERFGAFAYFVNIPTKFISPDGQTMWLCYSANWDGRWRKDPDLYCPKGGAYALTLVEFKFMPANTVMPKTSTAVEPWEKKLAQSLSVMGHRNWIVVADSAYPAQSSQAIETIATNDDHFRVLEVVLKALDKTHHVTPKIYLDTELKYVPEKDAPGMNDCRSKLSNLLAGRTVTYTPHIESIQTLDKTARMYNVLVLKTNLTLPYTSVFLELDCGYWNPQAEQNLRTIMKTALPSP